MSTFKSTFHLKKKRKGTTKRLRIAYRKINIAYSIIRTYIYTKRETIARLQSKIYIYREYKNICVSFPYGHETNLQISSIVRCIICIERVSFE